jgi:hypothetical protein
MATSASPNVPNRYFERVSGTQDIRDGLRIVSYNMLASGYCTSASRLPRYVNEPTSATAATMAWEARFPQLLAEVLSYDADIICLQEVEQQSFTRYWLPSLGEYEGVWGNRHTEAADRHNAATTTGVALFARRSKLKIKKHRALVFAEPAAIDELLPECTVEPSTGVPRLRSRLLGEPEPPNRGYNTNGEGGALVAARGGRQRQVSGRGNASFFVRLSFQRYEGGSSAHAEHCRGA